MGEFEDVVRRRRMTRSFLAEPLPHGPIEGLVELARRNDYLSTIFTIIIITFFTCIPAVSHDHKEYCDVKEDKEEKGDKEEDK